MRVLTLCLGIAIILTAACSSGSNGGAGGAAGGALQAGGQGAGGGVTSLAGTTSAGGVAALGGNTATGTIPLTGACASLTCLNPLVALLSNSACEVSATDTCTEQMDLSTYTQSACFSNGVKMQTNITTMTVTVKSGSSVCYSMVLGSLATSSSMTVVVKNGSGATVATIATDGTNDTVTCPGGTPTVVDATCGSDSSAVSSGATMPDNSNCTTGVCTF
ncbi:MAG: hypothetical protein WCG85_14540 [Polyangia bacterium]